MLFCVGAGIFSMKKTHEINIIIIQLIRHGDYSSTANCQTNIPDIFQVIFTVGYFNIIIYLFRDFSRNA